MGRNSGNRGRGGQQNGTPGRQQKQGSTSQAHRDHALYGTRSHRTPSSSGRGRGGHGRGAGRGTDTTPFTQHHHTEHSRSPWSSERRPGRLRHPGLGSSAAESVSAAVPHDHSRGAASVCAEDRMLLVVGKDAKMPRVWELRVHPSQRFSRAWLAAVDRWVENMIGGNSTEQALLADIAAAAGPEAAASEAPPIPYEPEDMDNFDYELSDDDEADDEEVLRSSAATAAAASAEADDSSGDEDSNKSDDDAYDMISYLNRLSITNSSTAAASTAEDSDIDAVSCAATAGSSIVGTSIKHRSSKQRRRRGNSIQMMARMPSGDSAAELAEAAAAGGGGGGGVEDSSDTSGSWETDDEAAELVEDAAAAPDDDEEEDDDDDVSDAAGDVYLSESSSVDGYDDHHLTRDEDESEIDTAVTAAEEQDLLCEPGQKILPFQHQQRPVQQVSAAATPETTAAKVPQASSSAAAAAGCSAAAVGASAAAKEKRVRRGERKRQRWQQQQQLLVSLRLERQGLTDKEAQVLSQWYTSSSLAQHLSVCKLWLFNNSLGDAAAAAVAAMLGPHTTEIHLSHNQIGVEGAKALLAAVPTARARGLKPLWFRIEWNQVDQTELKRFINQECSSRGLVVDIAEEVPVGERAARTDSKGRELNLSWSLPWQQVHVQMPWLSCQRAPPAEAAVLQAAKAIWGQRESAAARATTDAGRGSSSRHGAAGVAAAAVAEQQQQQMGVTRGGSGRGMGVVAAVNASLPMMQTPPPPPPVAAARSRAQASPAAALATPATFTPQQQPPPPPAAAPAAATKSTSSPAAAAAVEYQSGPLMLFLDTSALLAMLGCPGSVTSSTCFTLKLLQALAGSGRFGRGLPGEQQTFLVLADTVMKQLDSFKSAEAGVGGPVRRFLDKGLDEVGPKGLDFLTVLGSHEGEGLVVDRQAAVAGSRSPLFNGTTGQRSDLSIIEVGLFFRKELLAAAAAALAESGAGISAEQSGAEAQPVILVTNDNGQLQLAKAHGLPAFKLAGATDFEAQISSIIKSGGDLTSSALRLLMAPAATAGLGSVAGRSLQDDFDGTVSCLRGLLEAYQDLSGLLGRVNMLAAGAVPGDEQVALADVQQLLQEYQHVLPFEDGSSYGMKDVVDGVNSGGLSVLEASMMNISAIERLLLGWEERAEKHHAPSRVLKWAGAGAGNRT